MSGNIPFNPQTTIAPANSIVLTTEGFIQGSFLDDPTAINQLLSGRVDETVTGPIWGAVALAEYVPPVDDNQQGNLLKLATDNSNLTAFSVFNQANNMILAPGSTVQQSVAGMNANYFRLGSNARIAVQCDSSLAETLAGGKTTQLVSWDYTNQKLIAYNASIGALPVQVLNISSNSLIVAYDSGADTLRYTKGDIAIIQLMNNTSAVEGNGTVTSLTATDGILLTPSTITTTGSIGLDALVAGRRVTDNIIEDEEYTLLPADNGKWLVFGFVGTVTLTLDSTNLPNKSLYVLNAAGGTTVNLVAEEGDTIQGNTTVYGDDFYLVFLYDGTFVTIPWNIANSPQSLPPAPSKFIGWDDDGNIANKTTSVLLATVAGVDFNQTGKVPLYTCPTGFTCVITSVIVYNASIPLSTVESAFGWNGNADDVIASTGFTTLSAASRYTQLQSMAGANTGNATQTFGTQPTTPQGATATVSIDVFGYLRAV